MANMLLPDEEKTPPTFPVVCIGGSAGSLSAFVDILKQIPAKPGMAIVIVSHRAQEESGRLLLLLASATSMEVVEVTEGMVLEPNRIFVAPPHREITTDGVALRLAAVTQYHGWPTLVSEFLFSLASMCASRVIAIIVSGAGHDGSSALAAVKQAGGSTFAQSDARHVDMPQAAVDTNHVDHLLTARQIGSHLASMSAQLRA
jgi:chemotaxis response regulator CheB